jgi:hypothetical protein
LADGASGFAADVLTAGRRAVSFRPGDLGEGDRAGTDFVADGFRATGFAARVLRAEVAFTAADAFTGLRVLRAVAARAAGFFAATFFATACFETACFDTGALPIARPRAVTVRAAGVRAAIFINPPRVDLLLAERAGAGFARAFAATLVRWDATRAGLAFTVFDTADLALGDLIA